MARKPKPFTLNDLSSFELRLLEHPPTETTWVCTHVYKDEDKGTISKVDMINAGSQTHCVFCQKAKSKTAKTLWLDYVAACGKVGIEPGSTRWKKVNSTRGLIMDHEKGKWVEKELEVQNERT